MSLAYRMPEDSSRSSSKRTLRESPVRPASATAISLTGNLLTSDDTFTTTFVLASTSEVGSGPQAKILLDEVGNPIFSPTRFQDSRELVSTATPTPSAELQTAVMPPCRPRLCLHDSHATQRDRWHSER